MARSRATAIPIAAPFTSFARSRTRSSCAGTRSAWPIRILRVRGGSPTPWRCSKRSRSNATTSASTLAAPRRVLVSSAVRADRAGYRFLGRSARLDLATTEAPRFAGRPNGRFRARRFERTARMLHCPRFARAARREGAFDAAIQPGADRRKAGLKALRPATALALVIAACSVFEPPLAGDGDASAGSSGAAGTRGEWAVLWVRTASRGRPASGGSSGVAAAAVPAAAVVAAQRERR